MTATKKKKNLLLTISAKIHVPWMDYTHLYSQRDFFQWFFPHARIHHSLFHVWTSNTKRLWQPLSRAGQDSWHSLLSYHCHSSAAKNAASVCKSISFCLTLTEIDTDISSLYFFSGVWEAQFTKAYAPNEVSSSTTAEKFLPGLSYCTSPNIYFNYSQKN